jgi:DNA-binding transcriptional regulator YbjK
VTDKTTSRQAIIDAAGELIRSHGVKSRGVVSFRCFLGWVVVRR